MNAHCPMLDAGLESAALPVMLRPRNDHSRMPAVGLAPTKSIEGRPIYSRVLSLLSHAGLNSVMIKTRRGQAMACTGHTSGHTSPEGGAAAGLSQSTSAAHPRRHPCPRRSHKSLQLSNNDQERALQLRREAGPPLQFSRFYWEFREREPLPLSYRCNWR